ILFSSSSLYSMVSDVDLEELWVVLREFSYTFVGIDGRTGAYNPRVAWAASEAARVDDILKLFVCLTGKICRNAVAVDRTPIFLWGFYSTTVSAPVPTPLLTRIQIAFRGCNWDAFQVTGQVVEEVLGWISTGNLSSEMQEFINFVVLTGRWSME